MYLITLATIRYYTNIDKLYGASMLILISKGTRESALYFLEGSLQFEFGLTKLSAPIINSKTY